MKEFNEIHYSLTIYAQIVCACLVGVIWLCVTNPVLAGQMSSPADVTSTEVLHQSTGDKFTTIQKDLMRMEETIQQNVDVNTLSRPKNANKEAMTEKPGHLVKRPMGMRKDKGMMGMKKIKQQGKMPPEHDKTSSTMGRMQMMSMMGKRPGSADETSTTSLPGYAGAEHLYHLGEQGFFLDHAESLELSVQQRGRLATIKQLWQKQSEDIESEIDVLEKVLWQQTAAGMPNWQDITGTIRKSEGLRGDLRLTFIQAVGEAVKILSREQVDRLFTAPIPSSQNN